MKKVALGLLLTLVAAAMLLPLLPTRAQKIKTSPPMYIMRVMYIADTGRSESLLFLARATDSEIGPAFGTTTIKVNLPLQGYRSFASPELRQFVGKLPANTWIVLHMSGSDALPGGFKPNVYGEFTDFCESKHVHFEILPTS